MLIEPRKVQDANTSIYLVLEFILLIIFKSWNLFDSFTAHSRRVKQCGTEIHTCRYNLVETQIMHLK